MAEQDRSHLPPSPEDDAARSEAIKTIARKAALWGLPVAALAALCLLLGVPWWIVVGGVCVFAFIVLFDI